MLSILNLIFVVLGVYLRVPDLGNRLLDQFFALDPNLKSKITILGRKTPKFHLEHFENIDYLATRV